MNNKAKGEISEAQIIARLVKLGIPVSVPFGNNQRYDLVIDVNNNLLKVQCKTARKVGNGTISFHTCSRNGSYRKGKTYHGQIDIFLIYDYETDEVYCVPVELSGTSHFYLRIENSKIFNPNINWAKDFTFEKWLEKQASIV